jgi:hypothetical protein
LNNRDDPGFAAANNNDLDGRIIIRVTGRGPQGALAILEWEVQRISYWREPPLPASPYPAFGDLFSFADPPSLPPLPPPPQGQWQFAPPLPVPPPSPAPPLPPLQPLAGMVLLSWHIVSL